MVILKCLFLMTTLSETFVDVTENLLGLSWHDSAWIPMLNPTNIMDYFAERSNPFYDRTCNNEVVKMQRLNMDQLQNMTGLEYQLLHVQEPILYVIRKQHRHSPSQATPLANYYIIAGVVYQAPDLSSVINSRILCCVSHLQSGFEEAQSNARYHPSKGYWWASDQVAQNKQANRDEPSSLFQRQRVDMLLVELTKRFPIPAIIPMSVSQTVQPLKTESNTNLNSNNSTTNSTIKKEPPEVELKSEVREIKSEKVDSPSMKPPPEKKSRLG